MRIEQKWFIKDNTLLISLLRFHVTIQTICIENNIQYQLIVSTGPQEERLFLTFNTLEEAVRKKKKIIAFATTQEEIKSTYQTLFTEKKKKK